MASHLVSPFSSTSPAHICFTTFDNSLSACVSWSTPLCEREHWSSSFKRASPVEPGQMVYRDGQEVDT